MPAQAFCPAPLRLEPLILVQEISHRVVNEYTQAIAGIRLAAAGVASPEGRLALVAAATQLHVYAEAHRALGPKQRLLIEYKPFEPAFYHTDIADWGMASHLAVKAGPQARVLVDTGHHYSSQNIEQIVAWLLHTNLLGGFHFNDRRYADDDLTLGSIDPYQIFRIFHELQLSGRDVLSHVAFMIDQSHNLKGKMEAMVQTVATAQELWLKAALVDREQLKYLQDKCELVAAEELFRGAFWYDVRPLVREWRSSRGLPEDPLRALAESGYVQRISVERAAKMAPAASYA